jgi:hypothetical protein
LLYLLLLVASSSYDIALCMCGNRFDRSALAGLPCSIGVI